MGFDSFKGTNVAQLDGHDASVSLSQQSFAVAKDDHELRNVGIAAGSGFLAGSALTAAGEYGLMKVVEPLAKPAFALAFGMLGAGRMAGAILNAPALTVAECITPKYVLAGGLIAAGLVAGGYEFYKHLHESA